MQTAAAAAAAVMQVADAMLNEVAEQLGAAHLALQGGKDPASACAYIRLAVF